jgi:hypothetical protein
VNSDRPCSGKKGGGDTRAGELGVSSRSQKSEFRDEREDEMTERPTTRRRRQEERREMKPLNSVQGRKGIVYVPMGDHIYAIDSSNAEA